MSFIPSHVNIGLGNDVDELAKLVALARSREKQGAKLHRHFAQPYTHYKFNPTVVSF